MTITLKAGNIVKTLDFTPEEAGTLRKIAGGRYRFPIDEFLLEFFEHGKKEAEKNEGVVVPLTNGVKQIGKVMIKTFDEVYLETPFHFEPQIRKYPDGRTELIEVSLCMCKDSHDKS